QYGLRFFLFYFLLQGDSLVAFLELEPCSLSSANNRNLMNHHHRKCLAPKIQLTRVLLHEK
ncbi:hypothetical protein BpHYR1_053334, partial [Brachionus plicatilis]